MESSSIHINQEPLICMAAVYKTVPSKNDDRLWLFHC